MLRMCRHLLQAGLAWILYVTLGSPLLAAEIVLVNRPETPDDRRYEYPETLLQAILDRTAPEYGPARVERAAQVMSRERIFAALKHTGNQLHVLAEAPKPGWEEALIPIRIPNPNLSPQTPLQDASLWFDIERDLPRLKAFVRGEDERLTMSEGDESASRRVE